MKAIKANKIYTVDKTQASVYLAQGYDITSDDGIIIEHSPTATVSRAEYDKLEAELEKLRNQNGIKTAVKK
jgi:hypothetical protein